MNKKGIIYLILIVFIIFIAIINLAKGIIGPALSFLLCAAVLGSLLSKEIKK